MHSGADPNNFKRGLGIQVRTLKSDFSVTFDNFHFFTIDKKKCLLQPSIMNFGIKFETEEHII